MEKKYFYGNEISDYGMERGYVDYRCLAKAFDAVLNNNILNVEADYWEIESGIVDNSEEIEELNDRIYELEDLDEMTEEEEKERDELYDKVCELEREQDEAREIFQYYIVSDSGAEILKEANETVWYNSELDMYVWGVDHWGTSWDYVCTNIKIDW